MTDQEKHGSAGAPPHTQLDTPPHAPPHAPLDSPPPTPLGFARDTSLGELQRRLTDFAAARDWQPFHVPKNLAAALSVEAGELLEIFQWLTPEQAAAVMDDPGSANRVRDEVADVLAYLLQFCTAVGVDPVAALAAKIERNELRFPVPGGGAGGAAGGSDEGAEG